MSGRVVTGEPPTLRMAYADPPYIGQAKKHYEGHPDYAGEVDHGELIGRLVSEYPDGWALSLSTPSTHVVLDHCRDHGLSLIDGDIRLAAWVKPFAAFKRNVRVAYAWEPLVLKLASRLEGATPTRDFVSESITMKRGLVGAKPEKVCRWLFEALGLRPCDQLDDLFPGSSAVVRAWEKWSGRESVTPERLAV
jgi:hypothetical protein